MDGIMSGPCENRTGEYPMFDNGIGKSKLVHPSRAELKMPKLLFGRIVVILLSAVVFYFGIAGLKSGETRSRGYTFNRDENPLGYWFTILISLFGPLAIIYLMVTR